MIARFQIEDLIVQDASGVVFRAVDAETGRTVAVRRFFPFGADGGGLEPEEQAAYIIAINRLAGLQHPALRAVVCGGCDPVDGMPFIATEWVDGVPIEPLLSEQTFPPEVVADLLMQAMEACELLSQVLAEEAVWVETDLYTIILGSEESGRGFTFWISPLKWLGGHDRSRGLESLIALTEQLMGWQGVLVSDQAGKGLGAWLKWLRKAAPTASLREARENLAAAIGSEPPAQALHVPKVRRQVLRPSSSHSKTAIFAIIGLTLVVIGAVGWLWTRQRAAQRLESAEVSQMLAGVDGKPGKEQASDVEAANQKAAQMREETAAASEREQQMLEEQKAAVTARGGTFTIAESELLAARKGNIDTLEGTLHGIGSSDSGKTLYLQLSGAPAKSEARGAIVLTKADNDLNEEWLSSLVGHKIRINGKVEVRDNRPQISLTSRLQIKRVE